MSWRPELLGWWVDGRENHAIISQRRGGKAHFTPLASCAAGAKIINKNTKDLRIVNDGSHLLCLDDDAMHDALTSFQMPMRW